MSLSEKHALFAPPPPPPPSAPVRLIRVADHMHPSMPPAMRGGEVFPHAPRRPPPPPRCVQRENVSTPSGCAPSSAPARIQAAAFRAGSVAELHPSLVAKLEAGDDSVEVTFSEEATEDPTQRMARRSSYPAPESRLRESAVIEQRPVARPAPPSAAATERTPTWPRPEVAAVRPVPNPRETLPTLVHEISEAATPAPEDSEPSRGDRHARVPEPPAPAYTTPVVPALRVAVTLHSDGSPKLVLHYEGETVDGPTAILVPNSRADALEILKIFERANA